MASEGRESGPPKRGGDSELEDQDTAQEDSWVLATIDSWIRSSRPKEDIVSKVMTSFGLVDLRAAANFLYNGKWCQPQISVPNTTRPDYSRKLAEAVFDGLLSIQNHEPVKVNFWVSSEDIAKLPGVGPFPDTLDEPEVSARLRSVDNQLVQMMEKLKSTEKLEGIVETLAKTVTELQEQLKEKSEGRSLVAEQVQSTQQSYAHIAGGQQRLSRVQALQAKTGPRERSASSKRNRDEVDGDEEMQRDQRRRRLVHEELQQSREARALHPALSGSDLSQGLRRIAQEHVVGQNDGFQEVQRRKRMTKKGCSTVEAEGGAKPPYSVFISGTSTNTDEETVKEKLMECARVIREAGDEKELEIVGVEHIKLKIPVGETPRSKCWKVTVSPEWADHMLKGEAYPAAWGWRKWNQGPRKVQGQQGSQPLNGGA